ncbi:F-actin-monooxygenase MICAL3-like isoform X3 [Apostichopus japonicus]|uniref:F-actin-monooxygenase MICAL3-like isoform X3 n=1 Tax=Stichopus japonicus TaxID=307972 RepID=UPI003AB86CB2
MPDKSSQDATSKLFDEFVAAKTFKGIYSSFLALCEHTEVKPFVNHQTFYTSLKSKVISWKAKSLWTKLDKRANRKEYLQGKACPHTNVLVIGAGPCGLRTAIELAMLGAKVVIVEKRNSFSRNNVLHLWPFLINDLRNLGAKKFFGKFCAGAIDHISIRQLQVILMKVALLLGVEIHYDVMFEGLEEPPEQQEGPEKIGWRARLQPLDHPVSEFEFDVIIGADGRRNTLPGFARKEFRGKLAIAITANFINRHTQQDARVEEISGVAFIFNQQFFQDLKKDTGIDLENIVYYKDETHYFVMTAKKQSLLQKGVILEDLPETARLLGHENVNHDKLQIYARQAADFSTNGQLPTLDFALNHYGLPDIAMFDFTSIFAAKHAACVRERHGHKLLISLVGDSLLEPFWPTGSGCARGFLSAFDAAWMVKSWASGNSTPLQCLAEREAIYRILAQTTPENLHKNYDGYGINPSSRYPVLRLKGVAPTEVLHLYDTKDEDLKKQFEILERKATPKVQRTGSITRGGKLLLWCQRVTETYQDVKIENMTSSWRNGLAMCAIIHRYRPQLIDFDSLKAKDMIENNQLALETAEQHLGIPPAMTAKDMASFDGPDKLSMVAYISRIYDLFKDEVPEASIVPTNAIEEDIQLASSSANSKRSFLSRLTKRMKKSGRKLSQDADRILEENEKKDRGPPLSPIAMKRKSQDRKDADFQRKKQILMQGSQGSNSELDKERPEIGIRGQNKVSGLAEQLTAQFRTIAGLTEMDGHAVGNKQNGSVGSHRSNTCFFCAKHVYVMERLSAEGLFFHRDCFRCQHCDINLKVGTYCFAPDTGDGGTGKFYCRLHFSETQRKEENEKRKKAEEERQREEEERKREEERKVIHTIPEDLLTPISTPRSPPPVSPSGGDNLSVPMNKRYKATPERIVLQNMQDEIHRLTEEEQAKYNFGGDGEDEEEEYEEEEDESTDSEEFNEEERQQVARLVQRRLTLNEEGEEMTDEEMESDEDESYDSDEYESEEEDEEEEETGESKQVSYHNDRISRMGDRKMAWLNDISPQPVQPATAAVTLKEEEGDKPALRKISVDSNFGLSTLERNITTPRKEENKHWRSRMAQNYASFEDDLPYMKRQTSSEAERNGRGVMEDDAADVESDKRGTRSPPSSRDGGTGEDKTLEIEIPKDRVRTDSKLSNNSSFTISTPEGSVSDVPSPKSSVHALSDGRDSSSPTKQLSLPRRAENLSEEPSPPPRLGINLEPEDGGNAFESSTDVFSPDDAIEEAPQSPPVPSPRSPSPLPSPRRKLPQPVVPRGPSPKPSPRPQSGADFTSKEPPVVGGLPVKKPYESCYSRKNRGVRSPMLAAGNNFSSSFSKIPGMEEATSPLQNQNTNNAPNVSPVKVRPDSPIEFIAPSQTLQPSSVKADTLTSLQKDREVPSSRVRTDQLRELTDGMPPRRVSDKEAEDTAEGIPKNFEGEVVGGLVGKPGVYLSPLSESSTDPVFHDASTNLSEGCFSPDGSDQAWHSASSEVPTFQYENGIPKSESHSKEKKSRISLIRRDKKNRKGVRKSKGYSVMDGEESPNLQSGEVAGSEKKKSNKKKKNRKTSKQRNRVNDYAVLDGEVGDREEEKSTTPREDREKRRSKVPDIDELIKGNSDGTEKQLPRMIRKLTVDPDLTATFDLDESSSDEDEEDAAFQQAEEEGELKQRKGKGRRMWGKKFKRLSKAFNTKAAREEKEKRKMEEEELNAKLTRRVQREARKQHRQQQLKRHRMAQEIQRQLQEAEVKQRELEARGVEVEKALRREGGEEAVPEQDLMAQWFSLVNEKNALVRFESELMAQAWELELEDRHSHLEQEIRTRLAVDDSKKSEEDRKVEALLLEEMLEVVEQRDAIVAWLEDERLKEKNEDQDIESMMLQKGILTAVQ